MIVAEQKPITQIVSFLNGSKDVLILGCGECVTVCHAGGEKEVEMLATALRMIFKKEGTPIEISTATIQRQCDHEFIDEVEEQIQAVDTVLSLACGVGVQFIAERFRDKWVVPGLNTKFAGGAIEPGFWEERCALCGECILHLTGGICPVARCAKSLLNGPCGGAKEGKCEVSSDIDCAWHLVYHRLKEPGKLDLLRRYMEPKDWSVDRMHGVRRVIREDLME